MPLLTENGILMDVKSILDREAFMAADIDLWRL